MPGYLWALIGGAVVFLGCLLWLALRPASAPKVADAPKPQPLIASSEATVNAAAKNAPIPEPQTAANEAAPKDAAQKQKSVKTSSAKNKSKDKAQADASSEEASPEAAPAKRKYTRKKKTTTDPKPGTPLTVEEIVARAEKSVVFVKGHSGSGTGFVVHPGLVATNKHVIAEEMIEDLELHFPSAEPGQRGPFRCELVYKDPDHDLAFLHTEAGAAPLSLATDHKFRRGQEVVVIGNPGLGGKTVLINAVSRGILSTEAVLNGNTYYQLGISINPGNSGGPVLDSEGHVLGVVTLKAAHEEGLAFCIPAVQLEGALERVDKLTEKEAEAMGSRHRLQVVFVHVGSRGEFYKIAMRACLEVMEAAVDKGYSATDAMKLIRHDLAKSLAEYIQDDNGEIKREVWKIANDSQLPADTRKKFSDLWKNYLSMKANVEHPSGKLSQYAAKVHELTRKHDGLVNDLELLLGVDIREEN